MNKPVRTEEFDANPDVASDYMYAVEQIGRLNSAMSMALEAKLQRPLNATQAVLMYHIGDDGIAQADLFKRRLFLGSNLTYNLKKLIDGGYVVMKKLPDDRRSNLLYLTSKGLAIAEFVRTLYTKQAAAFGTSTGISAEDLKTFVCVARYLEQKFVHEAHFFGG